MISLLTEDEGGDQSASLAALMSGLHTHHIGSFTLATGIIFGFFGTDSFSLGQFFTFFTSFKEKFNGRIYDNHNFFTVIIQALIGEGYIEKSTSSYKLTKKGLKLGQSFFELQGEEFREQFERRHSSLTLQMLSLSRVHESVQGLVSGSNRLTPT